MDRHPSRLIGVITPTNEIRDQYYKAISAAVAGMSLDNEPPPIETFHNKHKPEVTFDQGGILVINAQACKGLEFDDVMLADINMHYIPSNELDLVKKRFYVMVSRARENVFMFQQKGDTQPDRRNPAHRQIDFETQESMMATQSQPLFDNHMSLPELYLSPEHGYLVTNHLNLMYMLSAGLIMSPSGFGAKYYRDTLGCFPGWIPLFIDKVFGTAVEESVSEANHLRSCLAQVSLNNLTGTVWVLRGKDLIEIEFPDGFEGADQVLFVSAPLPTAWIDSIVFRSKPEVAACNEEAKDYNNVPWTEFKRKSGTSSCLPRL